jgi:hypothetical protein
MNKALDEVRAAESRRLAADGHAPVLNKSRWCVLKHKENLAAKQQFAFAICSVAILPRPGTRPLSLAWQAA